MFGYEEVLEQRPLFGVIDENQETPMTIEEIRQPKSLFSDFQEVVTTESSFICPDDPVIPKAPFWRRQFSKDVTFAQRKFDWYFGVGLPIICSAFDPIVFRTLYDAESPNRGLFVNYKIFAYTLSIVSIMAMSAWLLWGSKLVWLTPFMSGLFAAGSVVALLLGIVLFPFSLIGTVVAGIGLLGFTPILSWFVFLRNSYRAYGDYDLFGERTYTRRAFVLAALFSLITPFVINYQFIGKLFPTGVL